MFALLGAASPAAAQAQDVAGRFEVRNAYVELADGAWRLDVRLDLALADAARQAFDQGVPLVLGLEAEASVDRRFLPARDVVQLERKWQLAYDAITDRFVVTDATTGEHVSHASQEEALAALSRITLPFANTETLPDGQRFDMRVRATVEVGELPAAVRMLLFWQDWTRSTEWYAWKVRP
jgi:acetylornithine deacetylase/succinyl-diaminopimelate desuccinylase-like protein